MDTGRTLTLKSAEIERHFPDEVASVAASFDVRSSTLNQQVQCSRTTRHPLILVSPDDPS
jgi:hypothetical protein